MKLYLSSGLAAHRRGRFLASMLAAEPSEASALPTSGLVLLTGEEFQTVKRNQESYVSWAREPGCALLLLPPYEGGRIFSSLDWESDLSSYTPVALESDSVAHKVVQEVMYRLKGEDGSSESTSGFQWADHSSHTRYWKAHPNSGVFAATVLPLWSISLLDQVGLVMDFLENIYKHTGTASSIETNVDGLPINPLLKPDWTVLVCCYGFETATAADLLKHLQTYTVPLLDLDSFDLTQSIVRLKLNGFVNDQSLTPKGLAFLRSSKFWVFAENLKEQV